jgi:hypothetical protein
MEAYALATIKIINDLTDDIYEGLMDQEFEDVERSISELTNILRDIRQTIKNEIH